MSIHTAIMEAMEKGYIWRPQLTKSAMYKHWLSKEDFRRCVTCENLHGKIWYIHEEPELNPRFTRMGVAKLFQWVQWLPVRQPCTDKPVLIGFSSRPVTCRIIMYRKWKPSRPVGVQGNGQVILFLVK